MIYAPALVEAGCVEKIASQIDLMPTLLGLTGYDKPFFAYGQDMFEIRADSARTARDAFAINHVDGTFQWITDSAAMFFDEYEVIHLFDLLNDPAEERDLIREGVRPDSAQLDRLKGFLQTYYEHLERSDFVVR